MINPVIKLAAIALAATAVTASAALAQVKLPPTVTMTAYDTGTSGFNIAVAIGKMMKDKYGSDVRVLPAGNDVARLQPLRVGRAAISAMGAGVYFAQEGVFEFATREWGPQPVQITLSSVDCNGLSLAVAADTGVKSHRGREGQARRLRRRLARAEPECDGDAGLCQPDDQGREDRRVRKQQRDVEGRGQQ